EVWAVTALPNKNIVFTTTSNSIGMIKFRTLTQEITFGPIGDKVVPSGLRDTMFILTATASSGLPVTYASSNTAVATIEGNSVTIHASGETIITASQDGNNTYAMAAPVSRSMLVKKKPQTIVFEPISAKTLGGPDVTLTATISTGRTITYSTTTPSLISITNSTMKLLKAGKARVVASQPGNEEYLPAASVEQTFCINPAKPTITITGELTLTPTLASSNETGNQWSLNGTTIAGATSKNYSPTADGVYTVTTTVEGCVSETSAATNLKITGLEDISKSVSVYPNPMRTEVFVETAESSEIRLVDMTGRVIIKRESNGITQKLDVADLARGMYLIKVRLQGGIVTRAVIKE
ncbi:MAG TPA: T9SS type A sorting domain-containing protein, partial [Cyclobacteriaceae bacterium]|nr:T9SS type A sorting domain-containing protein [Cyclobacteriaceae bacterium]